jgi:hypothetical protein
VDRGQVHTLEAIVAALLLLTSVVFALQMTAVTPLSASTSSQHIENQLQASAEGILSSAAAHGELKPAILNWNKTRGAFHNTTSKRYFTRHAPPNAFGDRLERAFDDRGIAYNVYVTYYAGGNSRRIDRFVYRGAPSDNSVRTAKSVVLTDDDTLYDETMTKTSTRLDDSLFYAPDVGEDSPTYNVVRVEVVAWRI